MKKANKYIIVVIAAIIIDFILWKIGGDCLSNIIDRTTNQSAILISLVQGICTLLVIVAIRWILSISYFELKTRNSKIWIAVIITTLFFGNSIFANFKKSTNRILGNNTKREILCSKVKEAEWLAFGSQAEKLNLEEYNQIRRLVTLPEIPSKSFDISYLYSYDGFLPDYTLDIKYKLPKNVEVKIYSKEEHNYSEGRTIKEFDNYNLVYYYEFRR